VQCSDINAVHPPGIKRLQFAQVMTALHDIGVEAVATLPAGLSYVADSCACLCFTARYMVAQVLLT
jgi:hypothetical protein